MLLAPIGFIVFQIWLGQHTGETVVWFRVQREAWDEGASFGLTAITNTIEAIAQPLTSPTDTITAVSVVATIIAALDGVARPAADLDERLLVGRHRADAGAGHRDRPAAVPLHGLPAADRRRRCGSSSGTAPTIGRGR